MRKILDLIMDLYVVIDTVEKLLSDRKERLKSMSEKSATRVV